MSGIAGILRRDGRPICDNWVRMLEEALALRGSTSVWRFEDSAEIESGTLELILLQLGSDPRSDPRMVVDGDVNGECALAIWDHDTLELELIRRGLGQKPLYMLNLGEAGDGVMFCSIPTPLIRIARELEIDNKSTLAGVQHYLQLGYVTGEQSLISPVLPVEIQPLSGTIEFEQSCIDIDVSPSPAEDLISLVSHLGQPCGDTSLLSRVWLYRGAKRHDNQFTDGLQSPSTTLRKLETISRWHRVLSHVPKQTTAQNWVSYGITSIDAIFNVSTIERLTGHPFRYPFSPEYSGSMQEQLHQYEQSYRIPDSVVRGMDAAAHIARIELRIAPNAQLAETSSYPLASWFRSPQSSLGQLLGDTLNSHEAFPGIPMCQDEVTALVDLHRDEVEDYSKELFSLLTLALWCQQVHAS